eukprot:917389-Amphidinium_carterae.1
MCSKFSYFLGCRNPVGWFFSGFGIFSSRTDGLSLYLAQSTGAKPLKWKIYKNGKDRLKMLGAEGVPNVNYG